MIWWLLGHLALGGCDLAAPPDAPFEVQRTSAERAVLLVEVWVGDDDDIPWARTMLATLEERSLRGTLVVDLADGPSPASAELLAAASAAGHDLALAIPNRDVPTDVLQPVRPLRKRAKPYEAAQRIRVTAAALGGRASEALLGKAGYRVVLQRQAAAGATPRLAGQFEGQPKVNVVLPAGAYEDDCGPSPLVGPFTPRAADRAMQAVVRGLSESTPTPVTRLALDGARAATSDPDVLGRWLDTVVTSANVRILTPTSARPLILQGFKEGPVSLEERRSSGRLVSVDEIRAAASQLATTDELPVSFQDGSLNPTELFVSLLLVAANESSDGAVNLRTLSGPVSQPESRGTTTDIDPEALRRTARQLLAALPAEIPAALPVDGQLLSAAELLTALASLVRGDTPAQARHLSSPDPHARGLGWGQSD